MASRQDKATTERHARTLRELVKRPDNKFCADCKKNDARWASWNIGCFVCIRCSGIHRSLGTHISKVKSVDLDTWTPEQMANIMKWGNGRANTYWEAHLKPGHIPADHKIESFIRSKYESRRWAMEGPPPADPSVLDGDGAEVASAAAAAPLPTPSSRPNVDLISSQPAPPVQTNATSSLSHGQQQARQLLSTGLSGRAGGAAVPPQAPPPATTPTPAAPANDLFSLDFHAPPSTGFASSTDAGSGVKKDAKQDILSLFSTPAAAPVPATGAFGQFGTAQPAQQQPGSAWDAFGAPAAAPQQSMMGSNGAGMWGVSSGWNQPAAPPLPAQSNLWGAPTAPANNTQANMFNTNDVWGSPAETAPAASTTTKKDDSFSDIWGSFK